MPSGASQVGAVDPTFSFCLGQPKSTLMAVLSTGSCRGILCLRRDNCKCDPEARRAIPWHIANGTGTERRRSPERTRGAEAPNPRSGTSRKLWRRNLRRNTRRFRLVREFHKIRFEQESHLSGSSAAAHPFVLRPEPKMSL